MAKYIDAWKLIDRLMPLIETINKQDLLEQQAWQTGYNNGIVAAQEEMADMPSADVVEIVRCRDCKHSGYQYRDFHGTEKVVCWKDGYGIHKNANGYCNDGDLKDEKEGETDG